MAIEYDLVILGATPEGVYAAERATQFGARVALILQGLDGRRSSITLHSLFASMQASHHVSAVRSWEALLQKAARVAETLTAEDFQRLMVQGCDVIAETGHLLSDRPLIVETPSRQLTTRAVLLAIDSRPLKPQIQGLGSIPYETIETFLGRERLSDSAIILGGYPNGIALAQLLRRWGVAVTLITSKPQLLGAEDLDVSDWITAQLRAEGIRLYLNTQVEEVMAEDTTILLKLPHKTVSAKELIVAAKPVPHLAQTSLETWFSNDRPVSVNAFLQTYRPRIYACGGILGGYDLSAIARQEAHLAVENALFWNRRRINYHVLPYALPTYPEMARVGLTETQAHQRYGQKEVLIARQFLYDNPKAQWRGETIGFCKIIAHQNGHLLGGHGVGPEASEWIQTLSWLMAQNTPWWQIARIPNLPYSFATLLQQATQQWECDRWQQGQWRRNWAENWCNWRRSR